MNSSVEEAMGSMVRQCATNPPGSLGLDPTSLWDVDWHPLIYVIIDEMENKRLGWISKGPELVGSTPLTEFQ